MSAVIHFREDCPTVSVDNWSDYMPNALCRVPDGHLCGIPRPKYPPVVFPVRCFCFDQYRRTHPDTPLNQTGLMLLKAVARGDQAAAEWMADVLSKWWANASHYDHEPFVLYGKSDFITIESVNQQWPIIEQSLGLDENDYRFIRNDQSGLQRHVFLAAIKNYWRDISLLTIEILLSWAASEDKNLNDSSLALYVAAGLLSGRHWRAGGGTSGPCLAK